MALGKLGTRRLWLLRFPFSVCSVRFFAVAKHTYTPTHTNRLVMSSTSVHRFGSVRDEKGRKEGERETLSSGKILHVLDSPLHAHADLRERRRARKWERNGGWTVVYCVLASSNSTKSEKRCTSSVFPFFLFLFAVCNSVHTSRTFSRVSGGCLFRLFFFCVGCRRRGVFSSLVPEGFVS